MENVDMAPDMVLTMLERGILPKGKFRRGPNTESGNMVKRVQRNLVQGVLPKGQFKHNKLPNLQQYKKQTIPQIPKNIQIYKQ